MNEYTTEKITCDICGEYDAYRTGEGEPYTVNIMECVSVCSICFKKMIVYFKDMVKEHLNKKDGESDG